jgi:hypothetical protein
MPARHTSLPDDLLHGMQILKERLLSMKEGVGETSGQTAGSWFRKSVLYRKAVRQKKRVFFGRCGSQRSAISQASQSPGQSSPSARKLRSFQAFGLKADREICS